MGALTAAVALAWIAIILLGFAMAGLFRQVHALAVGPGMSIPLGPRIGLQAPSLDGITVSPERSALILFASDTCEICEKLLQDFPDDLLTTRYPLNVVFRGASLQSNSQYAHRVEHAQEMFDLFAVRSTPYAAIIDGGVVIAATYVGSKQLLREFLARTMFAPSGTPEESERHDTRV